MKYILTFFISTLLIFISIPGWAEDFKIISFKGVVETSADQKSWDTVMEGQFVETGTWIRTGPKGVGNNFVAQSNTDKNFEKRRISVKLPSKTKTDTS